MKKKSKFQDCEQVKIIPQAEYKYGKSHGSEGLIFDIYFSDTHNEFVYEVDFGDRYYLCYERDLELIN